MNGPAPTFVQFSNAQFTCPAVRRKVRYVFPFIPARTFIHSKKMRFSSLTPARCSRDHEEPLAGARCRVKKEGEAKSRYLPVNFSPSSPLLTFFSPLLSEKSIVNRGGFSFFPNDAVQRRGNPEGIAGCIPSQLVDISLVSHDRGDQSEPVLGTFPHPLRAFAFRTNIKKPHGAAAADNNTANRACLRRVAPLPQQPPRA